MSKGSTFFHFILGVADTESRKKFEQILADQGDHRNKMMDKMIQRISQHEERKNRQQDSPTFFDKVARKLGGPLEKSPLDLEPEEFERLTKVQRDPDNQLEFELPLLDSSFKSPPVAPEKVDEAYKAFIKANNMDFDQDKNLKVDLKKKVLFYRGKKTLAKKFLVQIGVKPQIIQDLLEGKGQNTRPLHFGLYLTENNLTQFRSPRLLKGLISSFIREHQNYFTDRDITYDEKKSFLSYSGPKDLAIKLLKQLKLKEALIPEALEGKQKGVQPRGAGADLLQLRIPLSVLDGMSPDEANSALAAWLHQKGLTKDTCHLDAAMENLLFAGSGDTLDSLLGVRGFNLSRNQMEAILEHLDRYPMLAQPEAP